MLGLTWQIPSSHTTRDGGETQTHALMDESLAIDTGGACDLATDQRGQPCGGGLAQGNGACDIGAYEAFSTDELAGDVSCDATMDIIDALFAQAYDAQLRSAEYTCPLSDFDSTLHVPSCDTNPDGTCNVIDALFLQEFDADMSNPFCPASV